MKSMEIVNTKSNLKYLVFLGNPMLNQIIYSGGGEARIVTYFTGKSIL
jgi:hypothetical protein